MHRRPRCCARRTPGCSPARPASSTTWRSPARCGWAWCAARSPTPASAPSTPARRWPCPACATCSPAPTCGDAWAAPMPCAWPVTEDMKDPDHWPVAVDKACYVGDIVAVVVADSRYAAADARRRRRRRLRPAPAVVDLEDAAERRVVIHDDLGTNRSYTWALVARPRRGRRGVRRGRPHVSERYLQQRLIPMAMETRGRRRRARRLRRRRHRVLGHADPAHPQGDGRRHVRRPRAQAAGDRAGGRRRRSARSSTSTPRS